MRKGDRVRLWRNCVLYFVAAWLTTNNCLSLASDQVRGRFIGTEPIEAVLMEDNSDAFIAWRSERVKYRTIVHIDSHIDLEWVSDSELKRILDAKTVERLKQLQLNPLHPEERSLKPLTIMNYLYPAIMEGMVKELYWVPPDSLMSGESVLDKFKDHLIETLGKLSIDDLNSFRLQKGGIKGRVYGIPLTICKLSDLPRFEEAVILDIDVDYFDPPDIGKRIDIPATWPEEFITTLAEKGMKSDLVSICYSVGGGYLALEYRFLGDELADILKDPKGKNLIAAKMRRNRRLGFNYRSKGMYREAIEELRKALELKPDDASLHYGLGLLYGHSGKTKEAAREFARSTAIDPIYGDPLIYDADYYFNKKMYDKALLLYEEILKKNPTYLKGVFGAGLCSSQQEKLEKAVEYYRKFIDIYPNFYLVHFNLGVIYSKLERWKRAEEEYRNALELNRYYGKAYQNLGILYDRGGKIDKAIESFERAVENNPCFKGAHNNLGGLYARVGMYDEAINEFRKAVRIDPHYAPGYSNLGKIHLIQGNFHDALEAFQYALSIDPKNPWARYYLGRLYVMMNRYGEAISAYDEVIEVDPNFLPAYIDLAMILGEKGIDVDRALKLARKAVELKPTAQTFDLLARLYFRRGMYEEAEGAIESALELDPSNESIIRHREEIRRKMGYR